MVNDIGRARWHPNLREAKSDCSSDSACNWISKRTCKSNYFYICAADDNLYETKHPCDRIYERFGSNSKYNIFYSNQFIGKNNR